MAIEPNKIPKMRVQRMGKLWRVVYDETRTLALFGDKRPVDGGGFQDLYDQDGRQTQDGRILAMQKMSEAIAGQPMDDPEAENIEPQQ